MTVVYQMADFVGTSVRKIARNLHANLVVPDSQLLTYAKEGDNEAFSELVRRHQDFIFKFARGYLNDNQAAEDVTQDVFIKAYQGLPYFKNESQFSSWLYTICKNHCLNQIRRSILEENSVIENVNYSNLNLSM